MSIEAIEAVIDLIELGAMASKEDIVKCLRSAVAEAEKHEVSQEPVAWHESGAFGNVTTYKDWALANNWQPLYTHPQPKREPLTDKQIDELWESTASYYNTHDFARAIEAAHGIKENT